jgi:hypothetical protein
MTQKNELKIFPINRQSLVLRMSLGGLIGLCLIAIFLYPSVPNPEWGRFWWVRPFIVVPIAGAMGGAVNYFISQQSFSKRWITMASIIFSLIVFLIGLWMGIVVGLDGTYWD